MCCKIYAKTCSFVISLSALLCSAKVTHKTPWSSGVERAGLARVVRCSLVLAGRGKQAFPLRTVLWASSPLFCVPLTPGRQWKRKVSHRCQGCSAPCVYLQLPPAVSCNTRRHTVDTLTGERAGPEALRRKIQVLPAKEWVSQGQVPLVLGP